MYFDSSPAYAKLETAFQNVLQNKTDETVRAYERARRECDVKYSLYDAMQYAIRSKPTHTHNLSMSQNMYKFMSKAGNSVERLFATDSDFNMSRSRVLASEESDDDIKVASMYLNAYIQRGDESFDYLGRDKPVSGVRVGEWFFGDFDGES